MMQSDLTQFFLETKRLEGFYQAIQEKFQGIEEHVRASETRMAGKLTELDFVSPDRRNVC